MNGVFNRTSFKFVLGFLAIILVSFIVIVAVSNIAGTEDPALNVPLEAGN